MPRTGGVYAAPAGTKATPNTTIQSAPYNAFVDDLVADANGARPITAGGTGATNATAARAALGLAIGTNVQAYDAGLQSIAGLTTAANQMIYTTALDTYAVTSLTSFGRSLIDDANAAAGRTTLGLGTAALQDIGTSGATVPLLSTSNAWTLAQYFGTNPQVVGDGNIGYSAQDTGGFSKGSIFWSAGRHVYIQNRDAAGLNTATLHMDDVGNVDLTGYLLLNSGGTGATTASGARANLGLGSSATVNTGTSGATVPLLNGTNTWANLQTFSSGIRVGASGVLFGADDVIGFDDTSNAYSLYSDSTIGGTTLITGNIRLLDAADVTLSSTTHALQIGLDSGTNIAADSNEIQARNNGAAATLLLNEHGGLVSVGAGGISTTGTIASSGNYTITNSAPGIIFSDTTSSSLNGRIRVDASNFYMDGAPDLSTWTNIFRFELDTKIGYIDGSRITTAAAGTAYDSARLGGTAAATVQADIDAKAPLASPALTGNPTVPTQTAGNNSTRAASTAFVTAAINAINFGTEAAALSVGAIGTYALLRQMSAGTTNQGGTVSGSNLEYGRASGDSNGVSPSGTWRCMGYAIGGGSTGSTTNWLRIT